MIDAGCKQPRSITPCIFDSIHLRGVGRLGMAYSRDPTSLPDSGASPRNEMPWFWLPVVKPAHTGPDYEGYPQKLAVSSEVSKDLSFLVDVDIFAEDEINLKPIARRRGGRWAGRYDESRPVLLIIVLLGTR